MSDQTGLIDGWSDSSFALKDEQPLPDEKMAMLISPPNDQGTVTKFFVSPKVWGYLVAYMKERMK
jgi:hypothetical protein